MFDIEKIEINAAFYELFESVFGEDFFVIRNKVLPSDRIRALFARATVEEDGNKKIDINRLEESERAEVTKWSSDRLGIMNRYTSRIAYIGNLLHMKRFGGSYASYLEWLTKYNASDFLNPEISKAIWEKINQEQKLPESVKNA